jgi:antagonist of KipI
VVLRAIPGPQDGYFDQGLELFFSATFQVSNDASRMGYRLQGDAVRQKAGMPASIISEPSFPGGVQIPPDGQPIIILVEQTVGGYSKIATVISTDLQRLAQTLPGHRLRFARVSLEQACLIATEQMELMKAIKKSLAAQQRTILQQKPPVDESQSRFAELYPECLPPTM